ncbi:MAG TPA: hypothetical protein VKZ63_17085 [Kofleriaceae bacterium]|nr:hypothetical protein [Kofleriaceae bacterium]
MQVAVSGASAAVLAGSCLLLGWMLLPCQRAGSGRAASPGAPDEQPSATLAADDPIGRPATAPLESGGEPGWLGVAASPDARGVIAFWSEREVWVSRDDGRSFHQELAAPEPIGAVTVGLDGRVFAARHGGRLGMLTPGARTVWLELEFEQALALAQGGRWVALLCLHRDVRDGLAPLLWLSGDSGSTWRRLVVPEAGEFENQLRVSPDGTIDLLVSAAGELGAVSRHHRGHVDGRPFSLVAEGAAPEPFGLTHDGRTARLALQGGGGGGDRMWLEPFEIAVRDWDLALGAGPDRTLVAADGLLLAGGGAAGALTVLDAALPGRIEQLTGDGIGRSLAIAGRLGLRHSALHGWRVLFERPAPAGTLR